MAPRATSLPVPAVVGIGDQRHAGVGDKAHPPSMVA